MWSQFIAFLDFIQRVLLLFFDPNKLLNLSVKRTPDLSVEQERESINAIRKKIGIALKRVLWVNVLVLLTGLLVKSLGGYLSHTLVLMFRFLGYSLILWGVLSPVGWHIKTWSGNTLSEVMDEEWHRFNYVFGLFFLLLSYLLEK